MIYFDHASTSFPKPKECSESIIRYLDSYAVSPLRGHYKMADRVGKLVEDTRASLAQLLGLTNTKGLFFTANATHSLNTVIKGLGKRLKHIVICSWSHNSVIRPVHELMTEGVCSYSICPVDKSGSIDQGALFQAMRSDTGLLIFNHASNVTGAVLDLDLLARVRDLFGIPILLDATQSAGYISGNYGFFDFVAGTGHKALLGPSGIGFLYVRQPEGLDPLMTGGTGSNSFSRRHPRAGTEKFECGTQNALSISGLRGALDYIHRRGTSTLLGDALEVRNYILDNLVRLPNVQVHSTMATNSVPIISFNISDAHPNEVAARLAAKDICVRSGLHCAPILHEQLGNLNGSVRISVSHTNSMHQADILLNELNELITQKRYTRIVC